MTARLGRVPAAPGRGAARREARLPTGARRATVTILLAIALALGLAPAPAAAQSPSPPIVGETDTRSEGEGAGLVGAPFLVAAGVVILGLASVGATLLYLRLARED